jgi:hypothetical protein
MVLDTVGAHSEADAVERVERALRVHGRGVQHDAPRLRRQRGDDLGDALRQVLQAAGRVEHVVAARVPEVGAEAQLRSGFALHRKLAAGLDHGGHVADRPAQIGRVVQHAAKGVVLDADMAPEVEDAAHAVVERAADPEQAGIVVGRDLVAVEGVGGGVVVADGLGGRRAGLGSGEALEGTHEEVLLAVLQELAAVGCFADRRGEETRKHGCPLLLC